METRKLQQVGGGTFTVSVPKEWAQTHGLEAGAEVHLFAHDDGSIVLRSSETDDGRLRNVQLDIDSESPEVVERALRSAHAVGRERVTLRSTGTFTEAQRRAASDAKRRLIGTEVVTESDEVITLQNLLDASDVSVRQSVIQLQYVACSVHRRATNALLNGEGLDHDQVVDRAEEAERIHAMIARHFGRSMISLGEVDRLGVDRPELLDCYVTARELLGIARCGSRISRTVQRSPPRFSEARADELETITETTRDLVDKATTSVLDGSSLAIANNTIDRCITCRLNIEDIDEAPLEGRDAPFDGTAEQVRAMTMVLDNLLRSIDHTWTIAETAHRAAIRSGG